MTALVVYESMWGATRQVAEAVAAGLADTCAVHLVEVSDADLAVSGDVDLLVLGGPTHAFGMSRASTRADAARQQAPVISRMGVREWLGAATLRRGLSYAAFDTKTVSPDLPGSAAAAIARALRRRGGRAVAPPMTFRVHGSYGGLVEGEGFRARGWGVDLGAAARTADR
ncbi:MAG TPA: flavodoxin/nitric oxide synthase [Actinotalea sp.]|nr:flavodoxin/nitric oxide synthase [Actinotalea sp.]